MSVLIRANQAACSTHREKAFSGVMAGVESGVVFWGDFSGWRSLSAMILVKKRGWVLLGRYA